MRWWSNTASNHRGEIRALNFSSGRSRYRDYGILAVSALCIAGHILQ